MDTRTQKIRMIKARMLWRPHEPNSGRKETRYVQISMSGRWLQEKGFEPGRYMYIREYEDGSLTISPKPFYDQPVAIGTLDELKLRFAKLNIPTTR